MPDILVQAKYTRHPKVGPVTGRKYPRPRYDSARKMHVLQVDAMDAVSQRGSQWWEPIEEQPENASLLVKYDVIRHHLVQEYMVPEELVDLFLVPRDTWVEEDPEPGGVDYGSLDIADELKERIDAAFADVDSIIEAGQANLEKIEGVGPKTAEKILIWAIHQRDVQKNG